MAEKSVTINLPDSNSYTKANKIGLGKQNFSTPQALGGKESVTVGSSLRADQTSMGQLSGALKEFNQALSVYGGIQEKNEQRGLKEIRNASNEKRREMIGQEAEYFRSLGIRYQNIPEVKRGLGAVESGKMKADWESHLSETVLPSQEGVNGANALNSKQIANEFNRWREEWIGNSEILNRSQLAKDGFRADTDDFFDRAAPQWVARADDYYERNVEIPTAVERLMLGAKDTPELIVEEWKDITAGMPASRQKLIFNTVLKNAQVLDTETGYNEAINLFATIADSDIMMGNQRIGDTMTYTFGLAALKESHKEELQEASADELTDLRNKQSIEMIKANEMESDMRKALAGAENIGEEKFILDQYRQLGMHAIGARGGFLLEKIAALESARNTAATQRRNEEKVRDKEFSEHTINILHNKINSRVPIQEIRTTVAEHIKLVDEAFDNGTITPSTHSSLSNMLHSFNDQTTINGVHNEHIDALVNSEKPPADILNQLRNNSMIRGINKANERVGLPSGAFNSAFQNPSKGIDPNPSLDVRFMNTQVTDLYAEAYLDIEEKRKELAAEAIANNPTTDGKHSTTHKEHIKTNLAIYEEERYQLVEDSLVKHYEFVKDQERIAGMIASGRDPDDPFAQSDEAWEKIQAWDKQEDIEDIWKFSRLPDGSVSFDDNLTGWFNDIDLSKPITKHNQNVPNFIVGFQKLHDSDVFPLLNEVDRKLGSKRFSEAMRVTNERYVFETFNKVKIDGTGVNHLDSLKENIRSGRATLAPNMVYGYHGAPAPVAFEREYDFDNAQEDMRKLANAYSIGGMVRQDYMNDAGKIDSFFLGGVNNPELGFGYRFRKQLPFVKFEFMEFLNEGLKTAQGRTKRERLGNVIGEASEKAQAQINEILQMYTAGGEDPQDALVNLFDYHKSIYLKQGKVFDSELTLPMQ